WPSLKMPTWPLRASQMRPFVSLATELTGPHENPCLLSRTSPRLSLKAQSAPPKYEIHNVPSSPSSMVCAVASGNPLAGVATVAWSGFTLTNVPRSICAQRPPEELRARASTPPNAPTPMFVEEISSNWVPSKRERPCGVATQRKPSAVSARALTLLLGRPSSVCQTRANQAEFVEAPNAVAMTLQITTTHKTIRSRITTGVTIRA